MSRSTRTRGALSRQIYRLGWDFSFFPHVAFFSCWLAIISAVPPTLPSLLPEWHHLVELPLYQPVSLLLIQPFATRECLLYPCEWTVHHHLCKNIFSNILNWELLDGVHVHLTFSQYQPALTPLLLWPMVTLLRGLRSAAISMLKMSVRPRSNFPPAKNTWTEHIKN